MKASSYLLILITFSFFTLTAYAVEAKSPKAEDELAKKTNWFGQVHRSQDPENQIPDLLFSNMKIPVTLMAKDSKLRPLVEVKGNLKIEDAQLYLFDGAKLHPLESKKEFSILLFLNSGISELNLQLKKSDGSIQKEKILIVAPDIQEYRIGSSWGELVLSLGGANFKYNQTGFGDFVSNTGLLAASYRSPSSSARLSYYGDLDVSVWTLKSSPTKSSPQVLRIQGSAAYSILSPESSFGFHPLIGVQYLTLLSNGSPFGFSNLVAPEVGVRAKYTFKSDSHILLRLVYLPLDSLTNFKKIGTDVHFVFSKMLSNRHRLEFGVGTWTQFYSANPTTDVKAGLLNFKIGYSI